MPACASVWAAPGADRASQQILSSLAQLGGVGAAARYGALCASAPTTGDASFAHLDPGARDLFEEGRASFHRLGHTERRVFGWGGGTLLFPWRGNRIMNRLLVALAHRGLEVGQDGLCFSVRDAGPDKVLDLLVELAAEAPPDPLERARTVRVKTRETDRADRSRHRLGAARRSSWVSG